MAGAQLVVLLRLGLLAMVVTDYVVRVLQNAPLTLDFSAWYAGRSLTVMLVLTALAAWGFHTSLAGKPLFGRRLLED